MQENPEFSLIINCPSMNNVKCNRCYIFELFVYYLTVLLQKLKGQVKTAKVNCEEERILCGEIGITGYPTVRLYLSPNKYIRIGSQNAEEIAGIVRNSISQNKIIDHDEL